MSPVSGRVHFQSTSWSVIALAGAGAPDSQIALEQLCRDYWVPLYAYLRSSGRDRSDAEDLIQSFFLHVVEHGVLGYADPARGRFRTFLIAALKQFATRTFQYENAQRRRPLDGILSLDIEQAERAFELRGRELSPDAAFNKAWALKLLRDAVDTLRDEYRTAGKSSLFDALCPALTSDAPLSYRETAEQLQTSEGAIRVAVHRLRQRYGVLLRKLIGETVRDESEIDDELQSLMQAISSPG